jgi:hypothetical protein
MEFRLGELLPEGCKRVTGSRRIRRLLLPRHASSFVNTSWSFPKLAWHGPDKTLQAPVVIG